MQLNVTVGEGGALTAAENGAGHTGEHNVTSLCFGGQIFAASYYRLAFRVLGETLESEKLSLSGGTITYTLPQSLLRSQLMRVQLVGYTEGADDSIVKIEKSDVLELRVRPSLQPDGQAIEDGARAELESAISAASQLADELAERAQSGEFDGQDGISPTVEVVDTSDGYRLVLTDAGGAHAVELRHGQDGADGRPSTTLITRIVTTSAVNALTVGGDGSFALKRAEINIFVPETTVPSGSTSVTLRVALNDVETTGSYSYNSSVANSINLGQFRHGGSRAQVLLNSVGQTDQFALVGIAPTMSFYIDNSTPNAVAERYTVATLNAGSVWEYITKVKLFPSSSSYTIPAGTVVEIWGY